MTGRPTIPDELWTLMAEIGPKWRTDVPGHVRRMVEAFSALHRQAPPDDIRIACDIPYGAHERQKIDLYAPHGSDKRAAVVFVHGGAFTDGSRARSPEIFANVSRYFARHGIVGVNAGYRLAPEAQYPEAARDMASIVAWLKEHAAEWNIDPDRIFLMGHSAGAAHVATYAYDARHHPATGPGLAGILVISGRVRIDNLPENPNARKVEAYYGTDASTFQDRSPVEHVNAGSVPTFVAWAEYENPLIDVYCAELVHRLAVAKRRAGPAMGLPRHNHASIVGHIGTADDALGTAIREFVARPR